MKKIISGITAILLLTFASHAQSYNIGWYKIAGGGGTSSGGQYNLSGTIGQPDSGGAMTGGSYSLTGGFWALYAVQTTGAPLLTITYFGNQAVISWPSRQAVSHSKRMIIQLPVPGAITAAP